ncbi:MAG: hypothetical protein JWP80_2550 [Pseudomonas sp.]|nr:hypothetical protein [Pseudomonas sp.]
MRKSLIALAVSCLTLPAWADTCLLPPLQSKTLPYEQGRDVFVITGPYQFNLPAKPTALLAFEGVMAVFPKKDYVSYQFVSDKSIAEMLSQFTTRTLSAAAVDRYLYGVDSLDDLNPEDQNLIRGMRADLHLDCHARLTRYTVGSGVEIILQEPSRPDGEYRMLYFSNDSTHLVSVKGSKEKAFAVLQSIRKRSL